MCIFLNPVDLVQIQQRAVSHRRSGVVVAMSLAVLMPEVTIEQLMEMKSRFRQMKPDLTDPEFAMWWKGLLTASGFVEPKQKLTLGARPTTHKRIADLRAAPRDEIETRAIERRMRQQRQADALLDSMRAAHAAAQAASS